MFSKENLMKYIVGVIISIVFLSVFVIYNLSSKVSNIEILSLSDSIHKGSEHTFSDTDVYLDMPTENIFVEIKGEVLNPDVYEIEKGSIVKDLIVMSGGLTNDGDISNINQARELQNGECITVLSKQEILESKIVDVVYETTDNNSYGRDFMININTASKDELKTLSDIGDGLADSIIQYREENGPFKIIDDVKNVSRIGNKTFEKFKDRIKV